ncbi:MAG: hypothetical protein Q9M94_00880 [Candidatus Gracilibacteria bacterium]|nr:hypothetical protein [Candidatus Gracilibacteria bacterium]MDQ7022422.1 hypothetical protein [Candidatus Gracilibacteria bacterium]
MAFGENQEISTELSVDENNTINALGMISKAKQDGEININELINIENKIQEENIEVKNSTEEKLNEYRNKILEKGISINSSNKESILKYLEKEGFTIPNNIKNIEGDFSISIDENNNIIEEGFLSTTYNNDSIEVSENDFSGEFNSELTNEYLDGEGREIIENGLDFLGEELSNMSVPDSYLQDIKSFIDGTYESMSNEDKLLLITAFKQIQEGNYSEVLSLFENKLTSGDILNQAMIMGLLAISLGLLLLLGATMPVWLLAIGGTAVAGSTMYHMVKSTEYLPKLKEVHFKDKIEARDSIGNKKGYLKEDKLF